MNDHELWAAIKAKKERAALAAFLGIEVIDLGAPPEPPIGVVGAPAPDGRAEIVLNDYGRRVYGDNVRLFIDTDEKVHIEPADPAPDVTVEAKP